MSHVSHQKIIEFKTQSDHLEYLMVWGQDGLSGECGNDSNLLRFVSEN